MKWLLNICLVLPLFRVSHGLSGRHLEVLQLAQSRASTHTRASSRALAGFQKYTDELVDEYLRTGEKADGLCKNVSQAIKFYIEQEYLDNLLGHGNDSITECSTRVQECTTMWFSETNLEHIHNLSLIINYTRGNHSECRKKQAGCCNDLACFEYNHYRGFDADAYIFPVCYDDDLSDTYIRATEKEQRQTMEACLTDVYNWHDPLYKKYLACKNSVSCCTTPQEACNNNQRDFEVAHCVGHDYIDDHCSGHRACWDHESVACDATCDQVQNRVAIRKVENETGERIMCLLNVIVNDTDSATDKRRMLDDCKNKTYDDTFFEFWDIACPAEDFPPQWPSDKLSGYCAPPDGKPYTPNPTAVSPSIQFHWEEYGLHLRPKGTTTPYSDVRGTGLWDGVDSVQPLVACPGHYTDEATQRNTSFRISTDEDSYTNQAHDSIR